MKILVCTDGSQESLKAIEEASKIANGCEVKEVSLIHVHDNHIHAPRWGDEYLPSQEDIEKFKQAQAESKENSKKLLLEAAKILESNNVKVNTILKEGRPAETIVKIAAEDGFDMIVLGRRGLSGLKKLFLGSVSNAVLQEADTSVLIVK